MDEEELSANTDPCAVSGIACESDHFVDPCPAEPYRCADRFNVGSSGKRQKQSASALQSTALTNAET
jgi:hypothetical protein